MLVMTVSMAPTHDPKIYFVVCQANSHVGHEENMALQLEYP